MKDLLRGIWDEYWILIIGFTLILLCVISVLVLLAVADDTYYVTLKDGTIVECVSRYECNWESGK